MIVCAADDGVWPRVCMCERVMEGGREIERERKRVRVKRVKSEGACV